MKAIDFVVDVVVVVNVVVVAENQKVQDSKFGIFDKRGGSPDFHFFPNVNVDFRCFS